MVVDRDEPQGLVLQANEEARARRILPGMRYSAALGLERDLRAAVVAQEEIEPALREVVTRLRRFSPLVESAREEPGVLWIDAAGLGRLHPDLRKWAAAIRSDLAEAGFRACIAVGFSRFAVYAVARALASRLPQGGGRDESPGHTERKSAASAQAPLTHATRASPRTPPSRPASPVTHPIASPIALEIAQPIALPRAPTPEPTRRDPASSATPATPATPTASISPITSATSATSITPVAPVAPVAVATALVFTSEASERAALRRVPLERLGIEPEVRDLLAKLGVRTVADFLTLPPAGLGVRFGESVRRLHRLAAGDVRDPLSPDPPGDPVTCSVALEHPEADAARLLFILKRLLDLALRRSAERRETVAAIELSLRLDDGAVRNDVLRPAEPTLDGVQILDLLRLRLESVALRSGATDVTIVVRGAAATASQLELFAEKPKRDLAAADRALARLRAELGDASVVRARLRDGHLPEAGFSWEPVDHVKLPRPRPVARPPLVRRLLATPVPLPPRPRHEPDGWMLRGFEHGSVIRLEGPYIVAGGWWTNGETRREYHFAETSRGGLYWVFYDVRRRRWFLQGEVS